MSSGKNPCYWDNYKCDKPAQQATDHACGPTLYPDDDDLPPVDDDMKKETKEEAKNRKSRRDSRLCKIRHAEGDVPYHMNGERQFSHCEITIDLAALKGEILAGRRLSKVGFSLNTASIKYLNGQYDCPTNAQEAVDMSTFYHLKKKYGYVGKSKKGLLNYLEGMMAAYCLINHR